MDLPLDIIQNEIGKYFTTIDIYKLAITMPQFRSIYFASLIKRLIIKEITNRLKLMMGNKYEDFVKLMKELHGFISGSFIIQCMLNEKWDNSDIDIYIPIIGNNVTKRIYQSRYLCSDMDDFMYNDLGIINGCVDLYSPEVNNKIKYVRNYENNEIKFQIIGIEYEKNINSIHEFVNYTFDFDICKNIYCFNNEDDIIICNINDVLTKNTNFNCKELWTLSILRYMKYSKRGFKFNNIKSLTYGEFKPFIEGKKIKIYRREKTKNKTKRIGNFFRKDFFDLPITTYHHNFYCSSGKNCLFSNLYGGINHICDDKHNMIIIN